MPPRRGGRRRGGPQRTRGQKQKVGIVEAKKTQFVFVPQQQAESKCDASNEVESKNEIPKIQETSDIGSGVKTDLEVIKKEETHDATVEEAAQSKNQEKTSGEKENDNNNDIENNASVDLPYKVKVSHLPANYILGVCIICISFYYIYLLK